jgi:hypothetical protein
MARRDEPLKRRVFFDDGLADQNNETGVSDRRKLGS